jgi:hypothetical protein
MTGILAVLAVLILFSTAGAGPAGDAPSRSAALASELTGLLTTAGLDAVAVADPDSPDRFVAALAVPGVQLLVVDAKAAAPAVVTQRLAAKQYRDVYIDLQQRDATDGRIFVYDMGADGLKSQGGDVLYESGAVTAIFNGEPSLQKLSESAYRQRLAEVDQRYSRMLALLIAVLKPPSSPISADRADHEAL